MPGQPGGPGNAMSQQGRYNHKENLAGVGSAAPTAAVGNAEETPLPEGQEKKHRFSTLNDSKLKNK